MYDADQVRSALRAELLHAQPEAQVRRLLELDLTVQYAQQGIAFRGVHPVNTAMGIKYNCVVDRRVISRHASALEAHIAWLQLVTKPAKPRELSAKALEYLLQDLDNFEKRLMWAAADLKNILEADPSKAGTVPLLVEKFMVAYKTEMRRVQAAMSAEAKQAHIEAYKVKKAAKPKGPKAYVTDLHPHLHKKIAMPDAPTPDGSEEIVFQMREQMRLRKEAERAKYQAWSQGAEDDS